MWCVIFVQYYRHSRMKALHSVFPDVDADFEKNGRDTKGRMSYPRPLSEPPSPSSSRGTTPAPSDVESDDEVDSEAEVTLFFSNSYMHPSSGSLENYMSKRVGTNFNHLWLTILFQLEELKKSTSHTNAVSP